MSSDDATVTEFGDFWARKIRNFHNRFDANRDGKLFQEDFDLIAERLIQSAALTGKEAENTKKYFSDIWKMYFDPTGAGGAASADDFIENLIGVGKQQILETCFNVFNRFYKGMDTNGSGLVSLKEYCSFFYILGMSEELAEQSFAALDTNGDSVISRGEFIQATAEYFFEELEGYPSDIMFGPVP